MKNRKPKAPPLKIMLSELEDRFPAYLANLMSEGARRPCSGIARKLLARQVERDWRQAFLTTPLET